MTNVYEGTPDARQSADVAHPVSSFRPTYRALTPDEKALHDDLKAKAVELEALFAKVKPGRILFEIDGVDLETAKEAMRLGQAKLSIATKFVARTGL